MGKMKTKTKKSQKWNKENFTVILIAIVKSVSSYYRVSVCVCVCVAN